jgi:protein MpaA
MYFLELPSGKSVEGEDIPVWKSEKKSKKYLYLMAGVHGDEVEGVFIMRQIHEWLLQNNVNLDLPIILLPILNVDGYRAASRINANGVDLNRNLASKNWTTKAREAKYFPGKAAMSEPENQFLDGLFKKYRPGLIISFHSWKPMLNHNGKGCQVFADFVAKFNKYPVVADIDGHPTPGSLGEYGPEKYDCPVLTFEAPLLASGLGLHEIWHESRDGLLGLLQSDLLKQFFSA